jgi:hypothetical protein
LFVSSASAGGGATDLGQVVIVGRLNGRVFSVSDQGAFDAVRDSGAVPVERINPVERNDGGPDPIDPPPSNDNSRPPSCDNSGEGGSTPNPVKLSTGEKHKVERDFTSYGLYGLTLERTYRSMNPAGVMFGPHWLSNLEYPRLSFTFSGCIKTPIGDCIPRSVCWRRPKTEPLMRVVPTQN